MKRDVNTIELMDIDKGRVNTPPIFILVKINRKISKAYLYQLVLSIIPKRFSSKIEIIEDKMVFKYAPGAFEINHIHLQDSSILDREEIINLPLSCLHQLGLGHDGEFSSPVFSISLISTEESQFISISLSHAAGDGHSLASFTNNLLSIIDNSDDLQSEDKSNDFDKIVELNKEKTDSQIYYNKLLLPNNVLEYLNDLKSKYPHISLQSLRTAYLLMKIGPYVGHATDNATLCIPVDLRKLCSKKGKEFLQAIGNYISDTVIQLPQNYNQSSIADLATSLSRAIKSEIQNVTKRYSLINEFTSINIEPDPLKKDFNKLSGVLATSVRVPANYVLGLPNVPLALLDTVSDNAKRFIEVISSKPLPSKVMETS
ncbi:hypothetical protein [Piscirickettsia litoralis]|uniref:Condensation domain-containing protein n=1 Tax=Piscirickettsia litoralis TaxID=1891921 RepID=A0ABX3A4E3_9GAMM|nr:hypothetical protein [Piscirickettsia litoralis]ODN43479.1 hypothetical protein BGC07_11810 [Piscirickettsia litoralis]